MSEITTREATPADLELLKQFEQGVITTERPFDPTLKADPINYYDIEGLIQSPDARLVVAELEGQVAGCGYCRIEKTTKPYMQYEHYGYLGFMYVIPVHRGKGINRLIVSDLAEWAKTRQVNELRLDVYVDNTTAIQAYEKAGFGKHMIEMRMGI